MIALHCSSAIKVLSVGIIKPTADFSSERESMFSWRKRSIDYLWLAFSTVLNCSRDWKRDFVRYRWNPLGNDWVSSVDVLVWTAEKTEVEQRRRAKKDEDWPVWEFDRSYWWNQWSTETQKEVHCEEEIKRHTAERSRGSLISSTLTAPS